MLFHTKALSTQFKTHHHSNASLGAESHKNDCLLSISRQEAKSIHHGLILQSLHTFL